ncbi:MAG: RNA-binding protein [Pirellulaceae bacterium]
MAMRIYVGNLPWSYSSTDLESLFKPYGDVTAAEVIMDRETRRSRGFGFIQMASDADCEPAIAALNGQNCNGRPLVVNEARERTTRADGGDGSGGGGGRGGRGGYDGDEGGGAYGNRDSGSPDEGSRSY